MINGLSLVPNGFCCFVHFRVVGLIDYPSEYNIQAQTSNHSVILELGKHQTRVSFPLEFINGAYLPFHLGFEPWLSNWKACVLLPSYLIFKYKIISFRIISNLTNQGYAIATSCSLLNICRKSHHVLYPHWISICVLSISCASTVVQCSSSKSCSYNDHEYSKTRNRDHIFVECTFDWPSILCLPSRTRFGGAEFAC